MTQFKMENGVRLPLTTQEQADYDAQQLAWPDIKASQAAQINASNPAVQIATLTAALLNAGIITADALPPEQIAVANSVLESVGQPAIDVGISALNKVRIG